MGHRYSLDLRVRVADFIEAGHSCRAAAQHFDVSESFAIKLVRRTRDTGSPAPARQGRPPGHGKLVPYQSFASPKKGCPPLPNAIGWLSSTFYA
jgi:hypothetical protein